MLRNLFITLLLLCIGCGQEKTHLVSVELPAVSDTLYAETIALENEVFKLYSMLSVCDKYIVMVEELNAPYLRIIDSSTRKELYQWGEQGSGPNEFVEIIRYRLLNNNDHNDCRIEFFDKGLGEVIAYEVSDSTLNQVDKFRVDYDNRRTLFNSIEYIKDGKYSIQYDMDTKNKRYLMISRHSTDTLFSFSHFESLGEGNKFKDSQERQELSSLHWDSRVISRDRELFFLFNRKQNQLDIYHTRDGSVYKNIIIKDNFKKIDKNENLDILYRAIPIAGTDKVYTVGFYVELEKLREIGLDNVTSYLEEWNLDGTPARRFLIDKSFGQAVVIGDKLYGFSPTYGNQYYMYTIPD